MRVADVAPSKTPSKWESPPSVTAPINVKSISLVFRQQWHRLWEFQRLDIPDTTQTILLASAPPAKIILTPTAEERPPEIWNIHAMSHITSTSVQTRLVKPKEERTIHDLLSDAVPDIVSVEGIETLVVHLYRPGLSVNPPILPVQIRRG